MNEAAVTTGGIDNARPGREAPTGVHVPPSPYSGTRRREDSMVPGATFTSYYGKPILNKPTWEAPDIPGYFFLGGLAGSASLVAAGAQLSGRRGLERVSKLGSTAAIGLSFVGLIHDLGKPSRFLNMLRMVKPTSPMSIGSWLLSGYAPMSAAASASALTGLAPRLGALATTGAAAIGPAVVAYTAALLSDTAVPAWHDGYREMPFVFAASGATAAAGLGLVGAPLAENGPVRLLAALGGTGELVLSKLMERHTGLAEECFHQGKAGKYLRLAELFTAAGVAGSLVSRRSRVAAALAGAALLSGSALTRFGIFEAGLACADDPKYVVEPQRERTHGADR